MSRMNWERRIESQIEDEKLDASKVLSSTNLLEFEHDQPVNEAEFS